MLQDWESIRLSLFGIYFELAREVPIFVLSLTVYMGNYSKTYLKKVNIAVRRWMDVKLAVYNY